ncbi:ChrR family anti-sigma-E factor [Marimonas sp. MJW-29]|uniref:ChrR family anti-sigma-E factor n=1 Tax=Sulfitobacter sediminis TaxID=3234186 RepID=A0ABV3RLU1_9RHOB
MSIKHHLQEETLLAYAAGNLPEAFNLIVAAHVSLCDDCRAVVESYNSVGGAVLETAEASAMAADSLTQTLARLDREAVEERTTPAKGALPQPVQSYLGGDLDAVRWRPVGMGVKQAILPTSSSATARLLMIPAGTAIPDHSHEGMEMTLVLQGAFMDEDDRFARGDIEVADGSVSHTPVADIGEDCICLAVTDAPLKFKSFLPKIAQKFARL